MLQTCLIYICVRLAHLTNLGRAETVTSLICIKDCLTNPVGIWNWIDVIKGVFLSFELITVNNIINAVHHTYKERPSWSNLQILNSAFNFLSEPQIFISLYREMYEG